MYNISGLAYGHEPKAILNYEEGKKKKVTNMVYHYESFPFAGIG